MFDRWAIAQAYYWYDVLWGPTPYGSRLHGIGYKPACSERLEDLEPLAKEIYGRLVREHNRLYVGYTRYQKRNPDAPQWPGTRNMRSVRDWLSGIGALAAVESMVRS